MMFFHAYPRSGNTWIRFIRANVLGRKRSNDGRCPVGSTVKMAGIRFTGRCRVSDPASYQAIDDRERFSSFDLGGDTCDCLHRLLQVGGKGARGLELPKINHSSIQAMQVPSTSG